MGTFVHTLEGKRKKKKEESTNDTQQMWKSVTGGYKGH